MIFFFRSRLSGGSTHSEMLSSTLEKKKKKGILGKLKKLAKSARSMDRESDIPPSDYSSPVSIVKEIDFYCSSNGSVECGEGCG